MIRKNQCCNCKQIIENPDTRNGILLVLYCNNCIEEARMKKKDLKQLRDKLAQIEIDNLPTKSRKEIIALAKVGLNAVIDEVTGYQKERMKNPNSLKEMEEKCLAKG